MGKRIQLRRTKGWRKPDNTVTVSRPGKWGNPFPIKGSWIVWTAVALGYRADAPGRRDASLALYRAWVAGQPVTLGPLAAHVGKGDSAVADVARAMASTFASMYEDKGEGPKVAPSPPSLDEIRRELGGKNLGCWCPPECACHADVLLEIANEGAR